jgi:hypothetical protein
MPGVQKWKDYSGNDDRGDRIRGHHWALLGLIAFSSLWGRYVCLPLLMQLISGQLNPYQFIVDPNGVATLATFWDSVLPLIWQLHLHLNQAPLRVVTDAYFGKAPFIQPLLTEGIMSSPVYAKTLWAGMILAQTNDLTLNGQEVEAGSITRPLASGDGAGSPVWQTGHGQGCLS